MWPNRLRCAMAVTNSKVEESERKPNKPYPDCQEYRPPSFHDHAQKTVGWVESYDSTIPTNGHDPRITTKHEKGIFIRDSCSIVASGGGMPV
jgi:hypothetical protein